MRVKNYALYLYSIVKNSKRDFKSFFNYNIIAISRYRASISNDLYNLYIIIIILSRILRWEVNDKKFTYSIAKNKNNNNNVEIFYLIVHWRLRKVIT